MNANTHIGYYNIFWLTKHGFQIILNMNGKCQPCTTLDTEYWFYIPLNLSCEHVQREWMMLMTSPWMEALRASGPVETSIVMMWNRAGRLLATEKKKEIYTIRFNLDLNQGNSNIEQR